GGAAEALDVARVRPAKTLGEEHLDALAEHGRARPAEDALGGAVEEHHPLLLVHRDDRVHRRLDDAAHAGLGTAKREVRHLPLGELPVDEEEARERRHAAHRRGGEEHLVAVPVEDRRDDRNRRRETGDADERPQQRREARGGKFRFAGWGRFRAGHGGGLFDRDQSWGGGGPHSEGMNPAIATAMQPASAPATDESLVVDTDLLRKYGG